MKDRLVMVPILHNAFVSAYNVFLRKKHPIVRLSILILAIFLVTYPRLHTALVVGGDTLWYANVINIMESAGPLWAIRFTDKPLFYIILFSVKKALGLTTFQLLNLFPALLIAFYLWASLLFLKTLKNHDSNTVNDNVITYSLFFCAFSSTVLRSLIDLYASFSGLILSLIVFALFIGINTKKNASAELRTSALLMVLLFIYWPLWALSIATILILRIFQNERLETRRLLVILLPSIITFIALVLISFIYPPPTYWGLGNFLLLYLGYTYSENLGWIATQESLGIQEGYILGYLTGAGNTFVFFLGTLGLLGLLDFKSRWKQLLFVWTILLVALTFYRPYATHAVLIIPFPLLAGFGLERLLNLKGSLILSKLRRVKS